MTHGPDGLIHAKLLDGEGGARDLSWQEVEAWQSEQGCLWLHFNFEQEEAQRWIEESSGLNDVASNGLLNQETRPRTISRGNHLLVSLRGINLNPGSEPDDMVSLRIWTDGTRILSTRRRSLQSTEDLITDLEERRGATSAAALLVAWVDRIVERMGATVDGFEEQVANLEECVLTDPAEQLRGDISHLRRQAIVIRRYLAPQREALNRLYTEPLSWLDEMNRLRLREVNDRLIRHIEDIDAVRERAAMAREELQGRISEELNNRSYIFTVVATIFLPLGFFTGLMGINVGGMPGVDSDRGFWIVAGMCVSATLLLALLFRLRKWL